MADSFSKLFRRSAWARFDPKHHRLYRPVGVAPPSKPVIEGPLAGAITESGSSRPRHFGFKRDLPSAYFGKSLDTIQMLGLDGEFGHAKIRDADEQLKHYEILTELRRAASEGFRVPARLLNRHLKTEGYAMGIGGLVCLLPPGDLPDGYKFCYADIAHRRAYWVWIKSVDLEGPNSRPHVVVTFRKPAALH